VRRYDVTQPQPNGVYGQNGGRGTCGMRDGIQLPQAPVQNIMNGAHVVNQNGLHGMRPPVRSRVPSTRSNANPLRGPRMHTTSANGVQSTEQGLGCTTSGFTKNFVRKTVAKINHPAPSNTTTIDDDDRSCIIVEDEISDNTSTPTTLGQKKANVTNWLHSVKSTPRRTPGFTAAAAKIRKMRLNRIRGQQSSNSIRFAKVRTENELKSTNNVDVPCTPTKAKRLIYEVCGKPSHQTDNVVSDIDSEKLFESPQKGNQDVVETGRKRKIATAETTPQTVLQMLSYARHAILIANDANANAMVCSIIFL